MVNHTADDFKTMRILELVDYIQRKKTEIKLDKHALINLFKRLNAKFYIPFLYANFYTDLSYEYDLVEDYYHQKKIQEIDIDEITTLVLGYYNLEKPEQIESELISNVHHIYFQYKGMFLFLEDLFNQGYFDSDDAQVLLDFFIQRVHGYKYKKNTDIMLALVEFMKGKNEAIQLTLGELLFKYINRNDSIRALSILITAYRIDNKFLRRGVMKYILNKNMGAFTGTDDFRGAINVLNVVAEDMLGEDEELRGLIIAFINEFSEATEKITKFLKDEKGIIYHADMPYEEFYKRVKRMEKE